MIRLRRLIQFLLIEIIVLCLLASFRYINLASTTTLLIFNLLYSSLTFQLNGSAVRKLSLLAAGNVAGLFWNFVFFNFSSTGTAIFGRTYFDAIYTIIFPILNLLWVIPFWSLSIGYLPKTKIAEKR